jgi:hypothetical protein
VVLLVLATYILHYAQATSSNVEAKIAFFWNRYLLVRFNCSSILHVVNNVYERCKEHGKLWKMQRARETTVQYNAKNATPRGKLLTFSPQLVHRLHAFLMTFQQPWRDQYMCGGVVVRRGIKWKNFSSIYFNSACRFDRCRSLKGICPRGSNTMIIMLFHVYNRFYFWC